MPHIFSKTVCLSAVGGLPSLSSPHITQLCQLRLLHLIPTNILKSSSFYYREKSCDHLLILKSSAAPLYHIRVFLLNKCKSFPEKASGEFHFFRLTTFGSSQMNRELQFDHSGLSTLPLPLQLEQLEQYILQVYYKCSCWYWLGFNICSAYFGAGHKKQLSAIHHSTVKQYKTVVITL